MRQLTSTGMPSIASGRCSANCSESALSKNWRPWRTIAARLFWIHEDGIRKEKREALKAEAVAKKAALEKKPGKKNPVKPKKKAKKK